MQVQKYKCKGKSASAKAQVQVQVQVCVNVRVCAHVHVFDLLQWMCYVTFLTNIYIWKRKKCELIKKIATTKIEFDSAN